MTTNLRPLDPDLEKLPELLAQPAALGDHMHGMLMHGKLIGASRRIVDFVAAAIGAELHNGQPASKLQSRSGPS